MLRRVCFCLEQSIAPAAEPLAGELRARGIEVAAAPYMDVLRARGIEVAAAPYMDVLRAHEIGVAAAPYTDALRAHEIEAAAAPYADILREQGDVLYVTDAEEVYRALLARGAYVLPCRHAGNRTADFAGAPYVIEQIEEIGYEAVDMAYRRLAGLPWQILTTKRCIVRETTEEDIDSFYRIYAEPEITAYMEDLYADREAELAYIREYREKVYGFYGYGMWTLLLRDGTVIGRAGISWREGFDLPELGFVVGVPWQRQGYAYEACSAILRYAREELAMSRVQALVMQGNEGSLSLCRRLGFRQEGERYLAGKAYAYLIYNM